MKQFLKNNNFGKWGWSMIIYAAISYYIASAVSTDGLNFYPEAFGGIHGWNSGMITTLAGVAGWVALIGAVVFSQLIAKIGTKLSAAIINIVTGLLLIWFANTSSYIVFIIMVFALNFIVGNVQLNLVPSNIMNVWFPRKKGIALGWATMGMPICTATIILILSGLTAKFGSPGIAYTIFGIFVIVYGIVSFFWVKENPESLGVFPDNEPISQAEMEANKKEFESHVSHWTMKNLLKNRNTWGIGVGLGLMWATTVGIVSQLIPRLSLINDGQYAGQALGMLSAAALIGIAGSYFWGFLDTTFGTKKSCVIYGLWYIVAVIFLLLQPQGTAFVWISIVMVGIGIGGIGNLIPSMIGTCFGRYDYIQANKAIAPLNTIIRQFGIVLAGILSQTVYGYSGLYVILGIFDVVGIILVLTLIRENKETPTAAAK